MQEREIETGAKARSLMLEGIDAVANIVKVTLGPRGRNVVLDANPYRDPLITNDGVTIAREIMPQGTIQKTGAKFVKAVANKTNDVAGDGTTTATILIQAIITAGIRALDNKADAVAVRRGIEAVAAQLVAAVEAQKIAVKDEAALAAIATISCGDPELGAMIAEAVYKFGPTGLVTLEDSPEVATTSRLSEGLELRGGIPLPVFVTNKATQEAILDRVPVIVTDHDITNELEVIKIMEACAQNGSKSAVLIANSIQGEAMANCIINFAQKKFSLIPIRVQAWGAVGGEVLRDVAAATGATFMAKEEGFKLPATITDNFDFELFGFADRVIASKDRATIMADADARNERIEELEAQLPNTKVAFQKEALEERISRLKTGVAVISVGGVGETERNERKLRVEDAINAAKAALDGGVVPGGGAALFRAAKTVGDLEKPEDEDERAGQWAVIKAAEAPLRQMLINGGMEADRSDLQKITKNKKLTFDFKTGVLVDAHDAGILDPLKVVVTALKNAASESALFLTSEAVVVATPEDAGQ